MLIVGPSWVGDMVMAQSLFKLLSERQPGLAIDVLAPAWAAPVLARMPEVRRSIDMPVGHGSLQLGQRFRLGRELSRAGYGQAILLPNSLKSALVPFFAGIPLRSGWRGEMRYGLLNDLRVLDTDRYTLMVERFAALALAPAADLPQPLPRPQLRIDVDNQQHLSARLGLESERPLLGLCPGAEFGPAKQWPAAHFAAVAQHYIEAGWQVVILGSANDREVAETIVAHVSANAQRHCCNAAGNTSLVDAVDTLALCRAVVSNDSGLMHIAAAVAAPLVAVYGSTSAEFTPPLAQQVAMLSLGLDCQPCFQRQCPLGHLNCLQQLSPGLVVDAIENMLASA